MAIITKKIGFTIDIDEKDVAPASVNVFIYRLLNQLGYEHNIQSITIDDTTIPITSKADLYELPLGENKDLPVQEKPKPKK